MYFENTWEDCFHFRFAIKMLNESIIGINFSNEINSTVAADMEGTACMT